MLALNDHQLEIVMTAAGPLPPEKRSIFLGRVAARLQLRGGRFTNAEFDDAVRLALKGRRRGATVRTATQRATAQGPH